jgi:uncharacterized membrane protein (UPF0127 family)
MLRNAGLLLTLSWLGLGCACNRTEEPAAPAPEMVESAAAPSAAATAASSGVPNAAPSATAAAPACTVPFGEPAAIARKALSCPKDPTGNLKLPLGRVTFLDAPGAPSAEVELARDDAARERGLMYRTSMPENKGMLFSWDDERVRAFWMHNTCLPLDMLYITKQGFISGILEQVPTLNDSARRVDCPVAHVLELNAGWARAHGVAPGMKVRIDG